MQHSTQATTNIPLLDAEAARSVPGVRMHTVTVVAPPPLLPHSAAPLPQPRAARASVQIPIMSPPPQHQRVQVRSDSVAASLPLPPSPASALRSPPPPAAAAAPTRSPAQSAPAPAPAPSPARSPHLGPCPSPPLLAKLEEMARRGGGREAEEADARVSEAKVQVDAKQPQQVAQRAEAKAQEEDSLMLDLSTTADRESIFAAPGPSPRASHARPSASPEQSALDERRKRAKMAHAYDADDAGAGPKLQEHKVAETSETSSQTKGKHAQMRRSHLQWA